MENSYLSQLINDTYIVDITIPDMSKSQYLITAIQLKNQQYYFEYFWNNRTELLYLSIYKFIDGEKDYYLKNMSLINNVELSRYINRTDWEGSLYLKTINSPLINIEYHQDTINQIFYLKYVTDNE